MGRDALSARRGNWPADASKSAKTVEGAFASVMRAHLLQDPHLFGQAKPQYLRRIYGGQFGIVPNYVLKNRDTQKAVFVAVARQKAEGNAHERACKFFAPGLLHTLREKGHQPKKVIPCWWVFAEGIAKGLKYRLEIEHWFQGIEGHCLLWEDTSNGQVVVDHFETHIRKLLM